MAQACLNIAVAFPIEMIAELDRGAWIGGYELAQLLSALDERQPAQISAIEEQEIKGKQHQPVGFPLNGG
jgi:hypothetical protein